MKKYNVRLAYINNLITLIKEHVAGYGPYRSGVIPSISIHGKEQRIRVVFHSPSRVQLGELILECPINDPDPDNLNISNVLQTTPTDNWMEWMEKLPFMKREEKRDLYFGLDVLHLMALIGFNIKACLTTMQRVYVTGHLQPNAVINHGRFSCWFDVTIPNRYGEHTLKEGYILVNSDGSKVPLSDDLSSRLTSQPTGDDFKPYAFLPKKDDNEPVTYLSGGQRAGRATNAFEKNDKWLDPIIIG